MEIGTDQFYQNTISRKDKKPAWPSIMYAPLQLIDTEKSLKFIKIR